MLFKECRELRDSQFSGASYEDVFTAMKTAGAWKAEASDIESKAKAKLSDLTNVGVQQTLPFDSVDYDISKVTKTVPVITDPIALDNYIDAKYPTLKTTMVVRDRDTLLKEILNGSIPKEEYDSFVTLTEQEAFSVKQAKKSKKKGGDD